MSGVLCDRPWCHPLLLTCLVVMAASVPAFSLALVTSYSLYLLHMLVLARVLEFGAGLGEPVAWLLYLAMSLSLAFASERLVERPLRARSSGPVSSSTQATPPGS